MTLFAKKEEQKVEVSGADLDLQSVPISNDLLSLVRKLDGFNDKELEQLKKHLILIGTKAAGRRVTLSKEDDEMTPELE
jgi:hypothetical protein